VLHAFRDAAGDYSLADFAVPARALMLRDEGLMFLTNPRMNETNDLLNYLMNCPDEMVPTVIEAMAVVTRDQTLRFSAQRYEANRTFADAVSTTLREHRISYDLIDGRMIEFSSREMHVAVTVPALTLLAGRPELKQVESAYRDALDEISKGKPGDAITDAGTALQETLTALGCTGNALGQLIRSAKTKGFLAPHDGPLLEGIEKVLHWVSADRSESGDAHSATTASVDDAWFIVHIVGAVILRLVQGGPRSVNTLK